MIGMTDCPILLKASLRNRGGTASWGEPEGLICVTTSSKNNIVTGSNCLKAAEHGTKTEGSVPGAEIRVLVVATLSTKKVP